MTSPTMNRRVSSAIPMPASAAPNPAARDQAAWRGAGAASGASAAAGLVSSSRM